MWHVFSGTELVVAPRGVLPSARRRSTWTAKVSTMGSRSLWPQLRTRTSGKFGAAGMTVRDTGRRQVS